MRGWQSSIAGVREWSKLPPAAQDYLKFLSDYLEIPVSMVSTGTIPRRNNPFIGNLESLRLRLEMQDSSDFAICCAMMPDRESRTPA